MNNGDKLKVAFVCTHNSCRSQMAEALTKLLAGDVLEAYSAGTELKPRINDDATRIIKQLYNIDMAKTQHPKLITELPEIDILVKMGCNVACPALKAEHVEDWGLDDPTGKGDEAFKQIAGEIEKKVLDLKTKVINGNFNVQLFSH